jgi:AcrR family transcriptional regulator
MSNGHRKRVEGSSDHGTRDQILTIASNLFAVHGYYGTTTREIAEAVGVRQPSLFHHFGSKAAIMEALLEHDLARSVPARERIARSDQPAPIRLYRYLFDEDEVTHIASSRYNLAGVYTEEVRSSPEFEAWHRRRRRLHRAIERILRDGRASGDFIDFEPDLVREAILGILGRTLSRYSGGQAPFGPSLPDQVASLVLRALLVDTAKLDRIRRLARDSAKGTEPAERPAEVVP